jgi:hypothetical protein
MRGQIGAQFVSRHGKGSDVCTVVHDVGLITVIHVDAMVLVHWSNTIRGTIDAQSPAWWSTRFQC